MRAVYKIDAWEEPTEAVIAEDPRRLGRNAFVGHLDPGMDQKYRFTDVTAHFRLALRPRSPM